MDPDDAEHLITAGREVHETDRRRGLDVDEGLRPRHAHPPGRRERGGRGRRPRQRSLRGRRARRRDAAPGRRQGDGRLHLDGGGTTGPVARRRHRTLPGHLRRPPVHDRAPTRATARRRSRSAGTNARRLGPGRLPQRRRHADRGRLLGQRSAVDQRAGASCRTRRRATTSIRVRNFAAARHLRAARPRSRPRAPGDTVAGGSAGLRRLLRLLRRAQHRAVRQRPGHQRAPGRHARQAGRRPTAGTSRRRTGLPKRYITSVQMDPADPRTVYVTLAGYGRRWLQARARSAARPGRGRRRRARVQVHRRRARRSPTSPGTCPTRRRTARSCATGS